MSGGKPHLPPLSGHGSPCVLEYLGVLMLGGPLWGLALEPLCCGTAEEHLEALRFSAWFLGWAWYLPASEATWQAGEVAGCPLARQGMTPQMLPDQHLHLHLQQTSAYRLSSQAGTGISVLRNCVRRFMACFPH